MLSGDQRHMTMQRLEWGVLDCLHSQRRKREGGASDADTLAQSLLAFAHVAVCSDGQFQDLQSVVSMPDLNKGDWLVLYPNSLIQLIPSSRVATAGYVNGIREKLKLFPKRRAIDYHEVLFFSDAQVQTTDSRQRSLAEYSDQLELSRNENRQLRSRIREQQEVNRDLARNREHLVETEKRLQVLQDRFDYAESRRQQAQAELAQRDKRIHQKEEEAKFYKSLVTDAIKFPTTFEQIEDWINESLADHIVLHERAARELRKIKRPIDITALCEGIYFLTAHARYLYMTD